LQQILLDHETNNDTRAAAVEQYMIREALEAGVIKEIKIQQPKNPNKWGKTLAPWFDGQCREAKKMLANAKRTYPKGNDHIL
jgi:hypothetical protein